MSNLSFTEAAVAFTPTLSKTVHKHMCEVNVSRSKYNLKLWAAPGLMRCICHRYYLHMRAKANSNDSVINLVFSRYPNVYVDLMHKIKKKYETKLLLESKGTFKKLWRGSKIE